MIRRRGRRRHRRDISAFLDAQFASSQGDEALAAQEYQRALISAPANQDLLRQALISAIASGRTDAVSLARRLPGESIRRDAAGKPGRPFRGLAGRLAAVRSTAANRASQLIRPLLVAWAERGSGQTDSALAGLEPLLNDAHFRAAFAVHAAMIADQAGRTPEAARLYAAAAQNQDFRSLQTSEILASFAARQGRAAEALHTLSAAAQSAPILRIALPALAARVRQAPVATPLDGIAQAYLDLGSALQQDNQDQFATTPCPASAEREARLYRGQDARRRPARRRPRPRRRLADAGADRERRPAVCRHRPPSRGDRGPARRPARRRCSSFKRCRWRIRTVRCPTPRRETFCA